MATNPSGGNILTGQALLDASAPIADVFRDPRDFITSGPSLNGKSPEGEEFAGMGPWLEDDDTTVFKRAHELVERQELIAQSRLAQDTYYTYVKLGSPFYTLTKDPNKNTYRCDKPKMAPGQKGLRTQAVPNQAWDLVNGKTEMLLSDPPQPEPSPLNDSEEAQAAAEGAERWLTEDGGENGTNDIAMLYASVDKALTCATSYIEYWTDPVGGGYVPLQILAHPQAVDPANPMIGPEGMPTTDPILRYVTAPEGGQFTESPEEAAEQWQPKIRNTLWGREHWRLYPESSTIANANLAIGLLHCTLGEAKRRWPAVAEMEQEELKQLLDWQPTRFLPLLPPFQRQRFQQSDGSTKEKLGSSDERIMFYYCVLQHADPEHKRGAEVMVSGVDGGKMLHKQLMAAVLDVPSSDGTGPKKEVRCMDIRLVQVTPRADPDEHDPTGQHFLAMFCGATEFNSALATGYLEMMNQWLHPESFMPSTSSVQAHQIRESRLSGEPIPITKADDKPIYGNQPQPPPTFWQAIEWNDQAIRSIARLNKPVTGQDTSKEVSGKARQIAVQQGMVGNNREQYPVNAAYERGMRIKLQLAMRDFSTPWMLRFFGEDGSYKEQQMRAVDFALVGEVGIQPGTGTMLPPEQKVQYIANLKAEGMLLPEEAADAARPTYAQRLGLSDDPHKQYIERCVKAWLNGPPKPEVDEAGQQVGADWIAEWQQYQQQKMAWEQGAQAFDAYQQQQMAEQPMKQQADQENQKNQSAKEMEEIKHRHAMEAKQVDAQNKPQPAAPLTLHMGGDKSDKRPKRKKTHITKNPDGSMTAESVTDDGDTERTNIRRNGDGSMDAESA